MDANVPYIRFQYVMGKLFPRAMQVSQFEHFAIQVDIIVLSVQ